MNIFKTTHNVMVYDLNYGNHLAYDSLLSILHEVRLRWLKSINVELMENSITDSIGLLVTHLNVSYKSEARYSDKLEISMNVSNINKSRFTLNHIVLNLTTNMITSEAEIEIACFDTNIKKCVRIPKVLLNSELFKNTN